MNRSISIVEYKVQQAAFFLRKLENCGNTICLRLNAIQMRSLLRLVA